MRSRTRISQLMSRCKKNVQWRRVSTDQARITTLPNIRMIYTICYDEDENFKIFRSGWLVDLNSYQFVVRCCAWKCRKQSIQSIASEQSAATCMVYEWTFLYRQDSIDVRNCLLHTFITGCYLIIRPIRAELTAHAGTELSNFRLHLSLFLNHNSCT